MVAGPKKAEIAPRCSDCFCDLTLALEVYWCPSCEAYVCPACVVRYRGATYCSTGPCCGAGPAKELSSRDLYLDAGARFSADWLQGVE